jgi:tetratricopeptide (TPR) repeat protein
MTTTTLPGFYGRTEELAWLRGLWDACTARDATTGRYAGGPRMAVVVAESGVGKSRLVQALYQQLTVDPAWDPADVNYWPDAFQSPGDSLRVNPDPHGHEPKAPPRFLWLGLRWQPTDVRNVEERTCRLPEARDALRAHVAIADRYRTAWEHTRSAAARAVRADGAGEAIGQAADAVGSNIGLPFGGLIFKLAQCAASLVSDRTSGDRQLSREQESQHEDAAEEFVGDLREVFGGPGSAGRVLPTVLWLDDAQWIDATTLRCVRMLWSEARQRRWPLLLVVTHWEREWRELLNAAGSTFGADLPALARGHDAEVRVLGAAAADALDGLVHSRLPGLTAPQRQLLLQKAGGNFLSMVENLGELLSNPEAFEGGSNQSPLNPAGEAFVREWESERQKRVEQRFSRLASEVKTLLGWGSALGVRFLREVVEDYAERALPQQPAPAVLSGCVDPYAILGTPSPYVREFRDRAFHTVARKHFDRWGGAHAQALHAVLREHLVRWVNGSFDGNGMILRSSDEPGWEAPAHAAIFLDSAERRDLLRMAVEELPLSEDPDWTSETDAAALRARVLLAWTDEVDHLYDEVRMVARGLDSVRWREVPVELLAADERAILADDWERAGALSAAQAVFVDGLERARNAHAALGTAESLRDVSVSLDKVGNILRTRGDTSGALAHYEESLGIRRLLLADEETPDRLRDVSISLNYVGNILRTRGDTSGALAHCEESLGIRRRLLSDEETPDRLRDVSVSLNYVGNILESRGDTSGALAHYEESLGILRLLLADEETPGRLRDVSVILANVGNILESRGDSSGALAHYEESLGIARRLLEADGTLISLDGFAWTIQRCASAEISLSCAESALVRLEAVVERVSALESATDTNILDTAATYWERRVEALDALGWAAEAAESRTRAAALRARIAEIGGG